MAVDDDLCMDVEALRQAVADDRAAGKVPLAVVGTAGAVNTGAFDPLDELADFCHEENIWLHTLLMHQEKVQRRFGLGYVPSNTIALTIQTLPRSARQNTTPSNSR